MNPQPTAAPLRKPRHADGRLMSEDEIRGLDGIYLRAAIAFCVRGYEWHEWHEDVPGKYHRTGWVQLISPSRKWKYKQLKPCEPQSIKRQHVYEIPCYESDIAAAFQVNRPRWRWVQDEFSNGGICVMVWDYPENLPHNSETVKGGEYEVELGHKPTPADHAKARCIAALLLAAKIGE